ADLLAGKRRALLALGILVGATIAFVLLVLDQLLEALGRGVDLLVAVLGGAAVDRVERALVDLAVLAEGVLPALLRVLGGAGILAEVPFRISRPVLAALAQQLVAILSIEAPGGIEIVVPGPDQRRSKALAALVELRSHS